MNRYQKEKSREIKNIMRSDVWGRMTYKKARHKWKNGVRAFQVDNKWVSAELGYLGLSRNRLRELGQAYLKVIIYAAERNLLATFHHESKFDAIVLRFSGWSVDGQKYGVAHTIGGDRLRQYARSLVEIVDYILEQVDNELREFRFPSPIQSDIFKLSRNTFNPYYGDKFLVNQPVGVVRVLKGE